MKKFAAILLLLSLMLPFVGTYTWLRVEKRQVKRSVKRMMMHSLPREELVLLAFTETDSKRCLRWEHSREFEYNGQMYDVAESWKEGDTLFYRCWWDHAETKLNRGLADILGRLLRSDPARQERQQKLDNFSKSLFCETETNEGFLIQPRKADYPSCKPSQLLSPYYSPPDHPPKKVA